MPTIGVIKLRWITAVRTSSLGGACAAGTQRCPRVFRIALRKVEMSCPGPELDLLKVDGFSGRGGIDEHAQVPPLALQVYPRLELLATLRLVHTHISGSKYTLIVSSLAPVTI